jgi:hypothetical protein
MIYRHDKDFWLLLLFCSLTISLHRNDALYQKRLLTVYSVALSPATKQAACSDLQEVVLVVSLSRHIGWLGWK